MEPDGDGEACRAVSEMKVEKDQIGIMLFGRRNGRVGILGGGDNSIARIVLDEIF